MSGIDGKRTKEDTIPTIQEFEGFGEITVGGSVAGGDINRIFMTMGVLQNNPIVNSFLLANKVKLVDRTTKNKLFPRDGMPLQHGETYEAPTEEVLELPAEQENS